MKNIKMRALALLMAIVMVFGIMPTHAFATEDTTPADDSSSVETPVEETPVEETPDEETPEEEPSTEDEIGTIAETTNVAKVGSTEYATIDEAIANWTTGTTLTLLADVTLSDVIQLSSTEHHILDLGTYTMTAASKKDAIQIVNNGRSSASYALDIKADATNPGGITASGKAVVKTTGKTGVKDRPIIRFYGGVFTGTNVVYHSGSNGTNCPQFWFYGGTFNGTVYANRAKFIFYGGTFNGSLQMSVDSSADALIVGGTFKQLSNQYGSSLNTDKFTIGSAAGVYDREVYVDDNGYYVVAAAEPAQGIKAAVANSYNSNNYFYYSKAASEGMKYTDATMALKNNTSAKVTVYADTLDMTGINFKGTIVAPEGETLTITNAPEGLKTEGNVVIVKPVAQINGQSYMTLAEAFAAANANDTITLISDVVLDAPLIVNSTVILHLNGKKVTYNSDVQGEAMITNNGNLTINDSVGSGEIYYNYTGAADPSYSKGNFTISNAGTLTVNGGKIHIANLSGHAKYPIDNNSTTGNAVLVVNGGHLYNYNSSAIRQFCNSTNNVNSVTINGGVIEGYCAIWVQNPGSKTVNGSLSITGGEIKSTAKAYVDGSSDLKDVSSAIYFTISGEGGAWSADSAISITGGTINENVYLAEDAPAAITIGTSATYNGYVEMPPVAKVGDTYYKTFEEAVEAAFANAYANNGAKQTILTAAGEAYATLGVWGGIDWTLYADGTLVIAPTKGTPVPDKNAPTKRTYEVGEWRETVVYKSNGSASSIGGAPYDMKAVYKLIIEEGVTMIGSFTCQFPNLTGEVVIPSTLTYIGQEAFHKTPITKLTFAAGGTEGLCIANGAFKKTLITEVSFPGDREYIHIHHWAFGGSTKLESAYIPANVTKCWGGEHVDYFDNFNSQTNVSWTYTSSPFTGCTAMQTITFENEAVRDLFFGSNRNSTAEDPMVAYAGLTAYNTFDEALAAALENGETLGLAKNVTVKDTIVIPAGKTLTINLNGKTLSQSKACTESYEMILNKGSLTITGNGTIRFTDTSAGDPSFGWGSYTIRNEGTLVVENGTIEHKGAQAFATHMICAIFQYSGSTTINGGTISTPNYRSIRLWKGEMTINGGTFDGQVWVQAVDNSAKLTVNGGTFEPNGGDASSVFVSNATYDVEFAVTDGTFKGKIGANDTSKLAGAITGGKFNAAAVAGTNEALIVPGYVFGEADENGYTSIVDDPATHYIYNVEDLKEFRDDVNSGNNYYEGVTVYLMADIDLAGENWVGIGSINQAHGFMGNFDGNGFKIKNLTITNPTLDSDGYAYAGLFSITEGDAGKENVIKNLIIENVTISTTGHIVAAAIAYPYYTTVENVTVCGDINITGGDYTAAVLAYTRRCVNASNLTVSGNTGSSVTGRQVVGGVISDIQMNGGLKANYSNFSASGLTITGTKSVGGISGIIATQTLNGATVENVILVCSDSRVGIVAGSLGGTSTISNVTVTNVSGATNKVGAAYDSNLVVVNNGDVYTIVTPVAKIGDTYYATFHAAYKAAKNGDTIKLLDTVVLDDSIGMWINYSTKKITVDASDVDVAFDVRTDRSMVWFSMTINAKDTAILVNSGNVDFYGGAYNAPTVIDVESGRINIQAGSYTGAIESEKSGVSVQGGSFTIDPTDYLVAGYAVIKNADNTYGVAAAVAKIGNTYYATLAEAIAAAQDGDTIKLLADVALNESITNNKKVTLDLNGKTITGTDNATGSFGLITNKGELTITGDGKMTLVATNNRGWNAYSSVISNTVGGKLVVVNGTIEHLGGTDMAYAIDNLTNGKGTYAETVINGGTIKSTYRAIRQFLNGVEAQNILTVNGGTIEGANKSIWMQDPSKNANTGTLTVGANAVLNGDVYLFVTAGSTEWPVEVSIAASAVNGNVLTGNVPEGYIVEETNGTWGVRFANYVAEANGVKYESLQAAVNAGGTVTLLKDITENVTVTKAVTINGANFKYTGTMKTTGNIALTIQNVNFVKGSIDANTSAQGRTLTVQGCTFDGVDKSIGYAITVRHGSSVVIKNSTAKNYSIGMLYVPQNAGQITVEKVTVENVTAAFNLSYCNDSTFENVKLNNVTYGLHVQNHGNRTFTLKGWSASNCKYPIYVQTKGTATVDFVFEDTNDFGTSTAALNGYGTLTMNGLESTLIAGEGMTIASGVENYKVDYKDGTYKLIKAAIAKIGTVEYSSLQEAVDAAKPGATITLICDAEGPGVVINKNITIDFCGYTYTLTEGVGSTGTESNGFQILKGNTVRLQGGTLKVAASAADKFYILIQNYANLTVYNMTLDGTNLDKWSKTDGDSYTLSNNCGNVSINKSTVIANDEGDKAFAFDVCDKTAAGYELPIVTVYPSAVIEGKIEAAAKVGNSYYATLAHTVENAVAGKTITLQGNISGTGVIIDKNTIIDFNGYTYTLTEGVGSTGTESNGFQILKGNTVTLKNGTLKVADSAADKFYILIQNYADLTVNKMTLDGTNLDKWSKTDGDSYTLSNNSGNVTIGANTKIIANNDGELAFAFDACDKSDWGYELPVVTVNAKATIEGNIEAAAKIGNVYYATLHQAIDAAADGKTITLMSDINLNKVETVLLDGQYDTFFKVEGKTVTIDLNGKTISGDYTNTSNSNMLVGLFSTEDNGHLTLTGNGTVNLTEGEGATVYALISNYDDDCTITIENGTYTLNSAYDALMHSSCDKGLIVKGGHFTLGNVGQGHWKKNRGNGSPWIINVNGQNSAAALVSGGTYNFNVAKQYYAHEVAIVDANGNLSYVIDNGNGTWTVTGKTAEVGIKTATWNSNYLYGYATFKDAVASIAKGAPETTIRLMKNITVTGQFIGHSYAQNVVIDLNGYTMSSTDKALTVYRGGTVVTIMNGTVTGNTTGGTIQVTYGGKLILGENVTVKSGGQATALKVDANSTLIIDQDTTYILGGKNDLVVANGATVQISAGYFKKPVNTAWCAEGYMPTGKLANGYYSVQEDPAYGMVAQVGDNYYETLAAAIAAAEGGATVTLLTDIDLANETPVLLENAYNTYFKVENKSITIDLNGKTISGTYSATDTMLVGVFSTENDGHLVLTGNGTVNVTATGNVYSLIANYEEGCSITIVNGTYTLDKASDSLVYSGCSANEGKTGVVVNGGTFTLGNVGTGSNGKPWIFNCLSSNSRHAWVTGGTFNADVNHQYWIHEVQLPETKALKDNGDGTWTVVDAAAYVVEIHKGYKHYVGYATLQEAADAAAAKGWEVVVLNSETVSNADDLYWALEDGKVAVVDGKLEYDDMIVAGGKGTEVTVFLNKGAELSKDCEGRPTFYAADGGILNVAGNGTVITDNPKDYTVFAAGSGTAVINGGNFVMGDTTNKGQLYSQNSGTIVINDGTFISTDSNSPIVYCINGFVEINGGFFQNTANPKQALLSMGNNLNYINNQKITLRGGTFVNWNPMTSSFARPWTNPDVPALIVLADGYTIISEERENGDIWYTVVPMNK